MNRGDLINIALIALLGCSASALSTSPATLSIDANAPITVSGVSSGGYMANQYHIAHSDAVSGAGIIAAGPFNCAQGNLGTALKQCLANGENLATQNLGEAINKQAKPDAIADPKHLAGDRVWLFHGVLDKRVARSVNDALFHQYQKWVTNDAIRYVTNKNVNHGFPTLNSGVSCEKSETPFINACGYDAAGAMLNWLYPLQTHALEHTQEKAGEFYVFSQAQEVDGTPTHLAKEAYLYVPASCQKNTCEIHVSFHGCQQNVASIRTQYIEKTGINNWADKLGLVVMYPQVASDNPMNPLGCWDWWGYTGIDYLTQNGSQVAAVHAMVSELQMGTLAIEPANIGE